jgi:DNA invertase Pin-like site-specific DNA recombinase
VAWLQCWATSAQWREIRSLAEAIDTATPTDRAMWQMIGVSAELERSSIFDRAGAKAAQHRGVRPWPKDKLSAEQIDHAGKLIDKGEACQYVGNLLSVSRSTLYRALMSARDQEF